MRAKVAYSIIKNNAAAHNIRSTTICVLQILRWNFRATFKHPDEKGMLFLRPLIQHSSGA